MSQFRGNTGTLIIIVARARDIPNKRKMEKQNPYCLLRIMNLTDKTRSDIRGGQSPRWDEEFRFNIVPEIPPVLKLSVLDETKKTPVLIAETEIDFTPVFYSSIKDGYDNWYPLTFGGKDAGEIYLEMTFYPSAANSISGSYQKKSSANSSTQSLNKRRILPPIPGQPVNEEPVADDPDRIPPPIPRASEQAAIHSTEQSGEFYHSDSFRPNVLENHDQFRHSTTSLHSLPDVPAHNNITKKLPPIIQDHEASKHDSDDPFKRSLDPGRQQRTDLKTFAKNFTNKYAIPLFGGGNNNHNEPSRDISDSSKVSSNAFDELERQVQSDWEKNNPKPPSFEQHSPRSRAAHKVPPPVPSHGSSFNSSKNSLPPVPTITPESSYGTYDIIEPDSAFINRSPGRKQSPTRKPPSSGISGKSTSGDLDLSNLPFDATAINFPGRSSPERKIRSYEDRPVSNNDDNVLLKSHHAPTPYEAFVQHPSLEDSQRSSRSSPSRFKSSLPPH